MIFVFDTSGFVALRSYYRGIFPSLWEKFDLMVEKERIISTREVRREIEDQDDELTKWAKGNESVFRMPTAEIAGFVSKIYQVRQFRTNIEQKKLLKGGKNADPFVIATAAVHTQQAVVVTMETLKPNAARIPNICRHFDILCLNLEEFMEWEEWVF
jgi:hypothetical protein